MATHANSTAVPERTSERGQVRPVEPGTISNWDKVADIIERKAGLLSRVDASHHLTHCLLSDLDFSFKESRAQKVDGDLLVFMFNRGNIETLMWLVSELWETTLDARKLVDAIYEITNNVPEGK